MTELTWATYVDWLVATHGTLTAVAERLAAERGYEDSVESVERALPVGSGAQRCAEGHAAHVHSIG